MGVVSVIKYEGPSSVFAWKYPSNELATWSQLIVNESQKAVLFKEGRALDVFPSGRYTLNTANIPLLTELIRLPFGGKSPFTAEVWFVNCLHVLDIKWGTRSPIQLQDPKYGIFIPVRAFGQFGIQIVDPRQFLIKMVGTLPTFDAANIRNYFRGLYNTLVKDEISEYLILKRISIMDINAYLVELSEALRDQLQPIMAEYGIKILNFFVNDVSVPEDDPAVINIKEILSKKAEMDVLGFDYRVERTFDTLQAAAENEGGGSGGIMGAGIGLGVGAGMGMPMGQAFSNMTQDLQVEKEVQVKSTIKCAKCGEGMPEGAKFCSACGNELQKQEKMMKCGACGEDLPLGAKFCLHCGRKINPCPQCGTDLIEGVSECKVCGHKMAETCPHCNAKIDQDGANFCQNCGGQIR